MGSNTKEKKKWRSQNNQSPFNQYFKLLFSEAFTYIKFHILILQ